MHEELDHYRAFHTASHNKYATDNNVGSCNLQGIPCWGERLAKLQKTFVESFKKSSPDFQSQHGYAIDEPNQANLNICAHAVNLPLYDVCSTDT